MQFQEVHYDIFLLFSEHQRTLAFAGLITALWSSHQPSTVETMYNEYRYNKNCFITILRIPKHANVLLY
jgi:hypothetical protein